MSILPYLPAKAGAISCVLACFLLQSCADEKPVEQAKAEPQILAKVNDTVISQAQLDDALDGLLGNGNIADKQLQDTVLDSLIASRAMMLLEAQNLSREQKQALDLRVAKYKEDLLVKAYINRNAVPEPVNTDSVKAYYLKHPHEFGGDTVKQFEYIGSEGLLDDDVRVLLLDALNNIDANTDFKTYAQTLKTRGLPVQYKKAQLRYSLLQPPLKSLVINTASGEVSAVYNARQMLRLKVLSQHEIPPKPLPQVSADIRERLAPVQLKKALKALAESAKQQVSIAYQEDH